MDSPPEWVRFAFHLERPLLLLLWIGFWGAAEGWVPRVRIVFALGQGILFALNIRFQLWDCGWLWSRVRSCNGYVEYSYCSGGIFCSFSLFESGLRVHRSFWSLLSPILGLLRIQVEFSCFNFARHIFFCFFLVFVFTNPISLSHLNLTFDDLKQFLLYFSLLCIVFLLSMQYRLLEQSFCLSNHKFQFSECWMHWLLRPNWDN